MHQTYQSNLYKTKHINDFFILFIYLFKCDDALMYFLFIFIFYSIYKNKIIYFLKAVFFCLILNKDNYRKFACCFRNFSFLFPRPKEILLPYLNNLQMYFIELLSRVCLNKPKRERGN